MITTLLYYTEYYEKAFSIFSENFKQFPSLHIQLTHLFLFVNNITIYYQSLSSITIYHTPIYILCATHSL